MTNWRIIFTTDLCTFWLFFLWEVVALVSGWTFYLISSWYCYILMYNHTCHHNIHTLTNNKTISLTAVLQTIVVPVFTSYCCSVITTTWSMYTNTHKHKCTHTHTEMHTHTHTQTNNCAHPPANTDRLSSDTCSMRTSDIQTHNDVPDTVILPPPLPLTRKH